MKEHGTPFRVRAGEGQSQQQGEPQEGEDYDFSMQAEKEGDEQEGADAQQRRELAKEMVDSMKDQWQPITEQLEEVCSSVLFCCLLLFSPLLRPFPFCEPFW